MFFELPFLLGTISIMVLVFRADVHVVYWVYLGLKKGKQTVSPKTKLLPIGSRIGNPLHESSSLGFGIPGYDLWGQEGPAGKGNKVHSFVFRISIFCCDARSIRHRRS